MKLYNLKENSPLRVELEIGIDLATFHHIDGRFSYCTTSDGKPFRLGFMTPMKLVDGRYEIDFNPESK